MDAPGAEVDGAAALPTFGSTPEEAANRPEKEATFAGAPDAAG